MKVFQDFISKLDSTEKHESNFGNLCMKKGGSFQKERFSFLLKCSMGGGLTPETHPVRTRLNKHNQSYDIFCNTFNRFYVIKDSRRLSKRIIPRWRIGPSNCYTFSRAMRNLIIVLHICGYSTFGTTSRKCFPAF